MLVMYVQGNNSNAQGSQGGDQGYEQLESSNTQESQGEIITKVQQQKIQF